MARRHIHSSAQLSQYAIRNTRVSIRNTHCINTHVSRARLVFLIPVCFSICLDLILGVDTCVLDTCVLIRCVLKHLRYIYIYMENSLFGYGLIPQSPFCRKEGNFMHVILAAGAFLGRKHISSHESVAASYQGSAGPFKGPKRGHNAIFDDFLLIKILHV